MLPKDYQIKRKSGYSLSNAEGCGSPVETSPPWQRSTDRGGRRDKPSDKHSGGDADAICYI
ncbi:MAG: hypothetical protein U0L55_03790 [Acutalibacteraceae bacterium]|nr:hypothetical protein [Acutalibacteraceae bacterium]